MTEAATKRTERKQKKANGEGSVFWSDAQRRYIGFVTIGGTARNKPKRKKFLGKRGDKSRVARLAVEERMTQLRNRRGSGPGGGTQLRAYMESWIERADIRSHTRATYKYVSGSQLGDLGNKTLVEIEPIHIQAHLDGMTVGQQTKLKFYNLLRGVLQQATDLEVISRNPAEKVKPPRVSRRKMRALTPVEVGFLLRAARGDRLEAVIILALTSTMGPGELFALRRRDVHLSEEFVSVEGDLVDIAGEPPHIEETKTPSRRRRVDLPRIAIEALRARLKQWHHEGPKVEQVFTSAEGTLIRMSNLRRRWWKPLVKRAAELAAKNGVHDFPTELRMYDLRHTANALMGYKGIPLEVASKRMGHSTIRLTADVYGHIFPSMQRDAANRLQELFEEICGNDKEQEGDCQRATAAT